MSELLWQWRGNIQPVPLERARLVLRPGMKAASYLPKRSAEFRELLRATWLANRARPGQPFDGELLLNIRFSGAAKRGGRPDLSNLAKAVEDAMDGFIIGNDRQVRRLEVEILEWGPGVDPLIWINLHRWAQKPRSLPEARRGTNGND